MLELYAWLKSTNDSQLNVIRLTELIAKERVKDIHQVLATIPSVQYGGCMAHRLRDMMGSHGAYYNLLSLISTHFKFDTDTLEIAQRGGVGYTIFFQELFLYSLIALSSVNAVNYLESRYLLFNVVCEKCTKPVSVGSQFLSHLTYQPK